MAKIVKIPLVMKNGVKVTDIGALKENFDLDLVIGYFFDGKLGKWLIDRYYEDEAEALAQLDKDDPSLAKKLCEIFNVEYDDSAKVDAEEIARRNERMARLKQITDDESVLENIDLVAFDQEELAELYDQGAEKIYLCEGEFKIPKSKQGIEYVVIGNASVKGLPQPKVEVLTDNSSYVASAPVGDELLKKIRKYIDGEDALIYVRADLLDCSVEGISDMNYCYDGIHSRYEAERKAKSTFNSIYSHAQNYFSTYSSNSLSTAAADKFYELIKGDIIEITDAINNLNQDTREKNGLLIKELLELLDLHVVQDKIGEIARRELEDRYYQLPNVSSYTCQIEYDSVDHDPPGFFGKKDWWFDGMNAWTDLDEDLTRKSKAYCKHVSGCFRRDFIQPIVNLLERIK